MFICLCVCIHIYTYIISDSLMRIQARRICCCGRNRHIHTDYRNPVEEKGRCSCSPKRRGP